MRVDSAVERRDAGVLRLAKSDGEKVEDKKLADGAHEFEAMMLGQMLKGLSFGGAPGDDPDDSDAGAAGTVRSFGTEAVAKAISAGGGFGLARQMIRQVEAERDATNGVRQESLGGTKVR
jgi:Rod binding domain-containing protein